MTHYPYFLLRHGFYGRYPDLWLQDIHPYRIYPRSAFLSEYQPDTVPVIFFFPTDLLGFL